MTINVEIRKTDGLPYTRITEDEGESHAVRNYANPAEAVAYLTKRMSSYKQAPLVAGQVVEGSPGKDDEDRDVLNFAHLGAAVGFLNQAIKGGAKEKEVEKKPVEVEKKETEAEVEVEAGAKTEAETVEAEAEEKPSAE